MLTDYFCICIDVVVIAAQCTVTFFKIYCVPPNLGITRTWICRLNFAQRPIVSGLRLFNEPEISDSGPPAPGGLCSGFLRPEKIHRPPPDLNPRTLDLETSTLPRDHRGGLCSALWSLQRKLQHSAEHMSGKALKLCPWSNKWSKKIWNPDTAIGIRKGS